MLGQLSEEVALEDLRLGGCSNLTDDTVCKILTGCRCLRRLSLSSCNLLTPRVFDHYIESGAEAYLRVVDCEGIRPEMVPETLLVSGKVFLKCSVIETGTGA